MIGTLSENHNLTDKLRRYRSHNELDDLEREMRRRNDVLQVIQLICYIIVQMYVKLENTCIIGIFLSEWR